MLSCALSTSCSEGEDLSSYFDCCGSILPLTSDGTFPINSTVLGLDLDSTSTSLLAPFLHIILILSHGFLSWVYTTALILFSYAFNGICPILTWISKETSMTSTISLTLSILCWDVLVLPWTSTSASSGNRTWRQHLKYCCSPITVLLHHLPRLWMISLAMSMNRRTPMTTLWQPIRIPWM